VSDLNAFVVENAALLVIALFLLLAGLAIALAVVARRAGRLQARLEALTRGEDGRSLANVLEAHLEKVLAVARRQDELDAHAAALDGQAGRSVQGVGVVRYNTFEDTGGNQSFALALLDPAGDGVVLNSLHARNQTRLYARAVRAGATDGPLSAEESEAVKLASARALGR
jgi:hypothetical protein